MRTTVDIVNMHLFPVEACLKSVPFQIKGGGWVLASLRAQDQVDYKKLAALLNTRRELLMRPSPEEMEAAFGVVPGAVSPFPTVAAPCSVFMDARAAALPRIYCGMGAVGNTLEMAVADLIALAGAHVADLAKAGLSAPMQAS